MYKILKRTEYHHVDENGQETDVLETYSSVEEIGQFPSKKLAMEHLEKMYHEEAGETRWVSENAYERVYKETVPYSNEMWYAVRKYWVSV